MSSHLEQLPIELLTEIARYLIPYDAAFKAFGVTSSRCRNASEIFRFRNVRIRAHSRKCLNLDVQEAMDLLAMRDRYRYVQNITVVGTMPRPTTDKDALTAPPQDRSWGVPSPDPYELFDEANKAANEEAFEPLNKLLSRTHNLKLCNFSCQGPVPMTIVRTLNAITNCKLVLGLFHLQCPEKGLSAEELELVTAPCLHEVTAIVTEVDNGDWIRGIQSLPKGLGDALIHMSTGISPNLQHVSLHHRQESSNPAFNAYDAQLVMLGMSPHSPVLNTGSWNSIPDLPKGRHAPALSSLTVTHLNSSLATWLNALNLKMLRKLYLGIRCTFEPAFRQESSWLRRAHEFSSLESVEICGLRGQPPLQGVTEFLTATRSLKFLRLSLHSASCSLFAAISRHRASLENLQILCSDAAEPGSFDQLIASIAPHARKLDTLILKTPPGHRINRLRAFNALALAPSLRDLNLCFRPCDDPADESIELQRILEGLRCGMDCRDEPHDHFKHTDAKVRYVRRIFGEMILIRGRKHGKLGWPLARLEVSLNWRKMPERFVVERDWFQLHDFRTEFLNIRISEHRPGRIIGLWPCTFCPPGKQKSFHTGRTPIKRSSSELTQQIITLLMMCRNSLL